LCDRDDFGLAYEGEVENPEFMPDIEMEELVEEVVEEEGDGDDSDAAEKDDSDEQQKAERAQKKAAARARQPVRRSARLLAIKGLLPAPCQPGVRRSARLANKPRCNYKV
jgi:hypothetical protein